MTRRCHSLGPILATALLFGAGALPAARAEVIAIRGGDLYTISSGVVRGGTLLIEDGKIAAIGPTVAVPEGARVIDAAGKTVLPGLVTARMASILGAGASSVAAGVDPYSLNVSFALASGITAGYVQNGGGEVSAGNAVVKMAEGDLEAMVLREPADLVLGSLATMGDRASLRRRFVEAVDYTRKHAEWEKATAAGRKLDEPREPRGAGPILQLLRGEQRARVGASSRGQILAALELARDFGVKLTLDGVVEGWIVARELSRYDVAVVMAPRQMQLADEWINAESGSAIEQARILREAGVPLAIVPASIGFDTGGDFGDDLFTLPLDAAYAVGGGLDEQSALEAITLGPARILGVSDRIGSLEVGKDADVIVMNGNPLHYRTLVDVTLVNGKVLYERDKVPYFSHIGAERIQRAKPWEDAPEEETPAPPEP